MRLILFISLVLAFGCNRDFDLYSMLPDMERRGIKYIWKVETQQLIRHLVNKEDRTNLLFERALREAITEQYNTRKSLVFLFGQAYSKYSNEPLATFFSSNKALEIEPTFSNKAVLEILQKEVDTLIAQHITIVKKRVARLGSYITKIAPIKNTDQFAVDIQNATDQTKKYIATVGKIELWEVHNNKDLIKLLIELNDSLKEATPNTTQEEVGPLFKKMQPNLEFWGFGLATIGYTHPSDTEVVLDLLASPKAKKIFGTKGDSIQFTWNATPFESNEGERFFTLYALNTKNETTTALNQMHIKSASVGINSYGPGYHISIEMYPEAAILWEKITTNNVGQQIAITIDHKVYTAPVVNEPIHNGRLSISGDFEDFESTKNLCDILSLKDILPSRLSLIEELIYPSRD